MQDQPLIGHRHYKGGPSKEIERLRKIDAEIQQETVDWFTAQEHLGTIEVDYPIPAIRGWGFDRSSCILTSLAYPDYKWDSPVEREKHSVTKRGRKGFWAVKPNRLDIVIPYLPDVVGVVELSGRVIEHDYGWRGEVCVIVDLFAWGNITNAEMNILEARYQCEMQYGSIFDAKRRLMG